MKNFIVAEYSVSQKCFHVHDMKSMLTHNIENMIGEGCSDYIPIGVFENDLQAHDYIEMVRAEMAKRGAGSWVNDLLRNIFK